MGDIPDIIYGKIDGYFVTHNKNASQYDIKYYSEKYVEEQQKQIDKLNKVVEAAKKVSEWNGKDIIYIAAHFNLGFSSDFRNLAEALAELKR